MSADTLVLVLLIKQCSLQNIIRKIEPIQTVMIPNYRDFRETMTVFICSPIKLYPSHKRFTGLS